MHYKFNFQKKNQIWLFKDMKQCIIKNKRKIVMRFKDLKYIYITVSFSCMLLIYLNK